MLDLRMIRSLIFMFVSAMGRIHVNPKGLKISPQKYTVVSRQPKLKVVDESYKEVQQHSECFMGPVIQ